MLRPYIPWSPFLRSQHTRHRQHQRQPPERDRQCGRRREAHDRAGVRRGEDRHEEHQEGRHGRVKIIQTRPVALPPVQPQIARSMRPSLRLAVVGTTCLLLIPALTGGAMLAGQQPSAYVPLDDWTMPYVEHLIATGVIPDPAPLTRPLRRADVLRALESVDTLHLSPALIATLRRLHAAFASTQAGPHFRVAGGLGAAAANYARRDALAAIDSTGPRQSGAGRGTAGAGLTAEAYVAAQWKFGEVFFGRLDRNWGPPGIAGLLLSANPYGLDHFAVTVGSAKLQLQALATQLDDRDASGAVVHRFMVQHRLRLVQGRWGVALWEGTVLAGRDRSFEPWYLNALNAGILEQWNGGGNVNSFVGLDFERRARVSAFGQLMLDDIQVDRAGASDQKPVSYALTVGARGVIGAAAAAWRVYYTRVTNLTYRNEDSLQVPLYHSLVTGRNFDDYDQLTATLGVLPRSGLLLAPEITYLRQGEGDPRLPHPDVAAYPTTATIFQGVVERTLRLALAGSYAPSARVGVSFDVGVHRISNFQHASGDTRTRVLGRVSLSYRLQHEGAIQ